MPSRLTTRVQYMIEQSIMHGTSKTYNSAHSHYIQFCNQYQLPYWPKNQQQQELQLLYWHALRLEQVKASTLRSQYHGVKHGAAMAGYPIDDTTMFMLHRQRQSLTTTFGAKNKDIRKPFTVEMAVKAQPHFNLYNYNELVYYTAIVCNIVALMRPSEIYAKNQKVQAHKQDRHSVRALYLRNITPYLDHNQQPMFYTCTCRATKTDKARVDVDVVWAKAPWPASPADLISAMLLARQILAKTNPKMQLTIDSPLFLLDTGKILTRSNIKKRFQKLIQQMNLNLADFKLYSLRIGGATSMARRGVDHRVIQIAGRWKTDCYRVYIRMTPQMVAQRQTYFLSKPITNDTIIFDEDKIPQQFRLTL